MDDRFLFNYNSSRALVNRAGRKPVRAGRSALRNMPSWNTVIAADPGAYNSIPGCGGGGGGGGHGGGGCGARVVSVTNYICFWLRYRRAAVGYACNLLSAPKSSEMRGGSCQLDLLLTTIIIGPGPSAMADNTADCRLICLLYNQSATPPRLTTVCYYAAKPVFLFAECRN